jgi:hypothetical protein
MSVAQFPAPVAAVGGAEVLVFEVPIGNSQKTYLGPPGIYSLEIWHQSGGIQAASKVTLMGLNGISEVSSSEFSDLESASNNNKLSVTLRATDDVGSVVISSTSQAWVSIKLNSEFTQGQLIQTITYATSQSLTFTNPTLGLLVGAGAAAGGRSAYFGGDGGGSGQIEILGFIEPGTYSLVAGAPNGGTSTFNGFSATGGSGRTGGSAGGNRGGYGGAGESGFVGGGGTEGSGVLLPFFVGSGVAGAGGGSNSQASGQAGGVYAGGGGGGSINNSNQGGFGGGGGGALAGSGSNGGAGGLIVLVGA